ncbi:MAG: hypothetical protein V2J07_12375 [Anaerolineae bacterium]|jgi:hypothetical protein|nr:hypothetical protein [Anaerolineae bacterium]
MVGKLIGYIFSGILIFFGVLFIWGAFGENGSPGWIIVGLLSVGIGFGLIFLLARSKKGAQAGETKITYEIDLPGEVSMDTIKCQSCGGALTQNDIKMVAGAPVVTCPYCETTYQLTEDPKW